MRELGKYVRDTQRNRADVFMARIKSTNANGSYQIVPLDRIGSDEYGTDQEVPAWPKNTGDRYQIGQTILAGSAQASGRSPNGGYSILGLPPGSGKGASVTEVHVITTTPRAAATVARISPNPIELDAGGSGVEVVITGTGLTGATLDYGHVLVTASVGPVVGATSITLTLVAATLCPGGVYDLALTVGAQTIRIADLILVDGIVGTIWMTPASTEAPIRVSPSMDLLDSATSMRTTGTCLDPLGASLYLLTQTPARLTISTGAIETLSPHPDGYANPANQLEFAMVSDGTQLWYNRSSTSTLHRVNIADGTATEASGAVLAASMVWDGTHVYAMCSNSTVRKYTTAGTLVTNSANLGNGSGIAMVQDSAYLYIVNQRAAPNGRIWKVRKSDLALSATLTGFDSPWSATILGGELWVVDKSTASPGDLVRVDVDTMAETSRTAISDQPCSIVTDGEYLYVGGKRSSGNSYLKVYDTTPALLGTYAHGSNIRPYQIHFCPGV